MAEISFSSPTPLLGPALLAGLLLLLGACAQKPEQPVEAQVENTEHICSSCHGFDGRSVSPTFPRLAGQQKDYLVAQLKAFRDKTRADPHAHTYMWGMAAKLSDPVIDGLAAYYSSQAPAQVAAGDPTLIAAGQKLYQEGSPSGDIPACAACHGDKAEGNGEIPRLASQHRDYLEQQLSAFATNSRANEIMHENAKNITEQQARDLAIYLSSTQ